MIIGVLRVVLALPASDSLKDKRQLVKSVLARVRARFDVAGAEVGSLDDRHLATLGFSCVSNDARLASQVMHRVLSFVEETRLDAEVVDQVIDVMVVD